MKNEIQLITTTPTIEGWEIIKYQGIVTHQIVIGANIFRDVFASFRDIFGGSVRGYQKDLDSMQVVLLQQLKEKAANMGANMIISLKLDYEDVSGGGKSMFMITATGTAVLTKPYTVNGNKFKEEKEAIDSRLLNYEISREKFIANLKNKSITLTSSSGINNLIYYKIYHPSIIIDFIIKYYHKYDFDILYSYFSSFPEDKLNKLLISDNLIKIKNDKFETILKILKNLKWYSYPIIIHFLQKNNIHSISKGLYLLTLEPDQYVKNDLQQFDNIISLLESLDEKYPIIKSTKNIIGREKKSWTCINCNEDVPIDLYICTTPDCYSNYFGVIQNLSNPDSMKSLYSDRKKTLLRLFK